jgi:hypothetical protein
MFALLLPLCGITPCTRRAALGTAAAALASCAAPRAEALNLERLVYQLDRDATQRTPADFTPALQVTPIAGPLGITQAALVLNGEGGDFEYIWLKNAETNKPIAGAIRSSRGPKPYVLKAILTRGAIVQPMAYGSSCGLWEGDSFELAVGDWKPRSKYPGYPKTLGGVGLFDNVKPPDLPPVVLNRSAQPSIQVPKVDLAPPDLKEIRASLKAKSGPLAGP